MALLFIDSFDHYASVDITEKWPLVTSCAINVSGRTGSCGQVQSTGASLGYTPTPGDVMIIGFAVKYNSAIPGPTVVTFSFQESGTVHIACYLDASGFVVVKRGTTTLATATSHAFTFNTWYYVECKVVIHDSAGSVEVRVDGVTVTFNASLTGIDTKNGLTGVVNQIYFAGGVLSPYTFIDDVYICDDAGSVNNDFRGVCVVERLLPSPAAAGTHQDFTCSTGTDHGALVDENPPNDDTDYVSSSTVGHQDTFNYPALALSGTILGVQTNLHTRKTDVGARTVAPLLRTGSTPTTYAGTAVSPLTTYKYHTAIQELNPNTGAAWTVAEIAALEAGMKIVS